jgi:predicted NBD/HSP70 family sugar kinase
LLTCISSHSCSERVIFSWCESQCGEDRSNGSIAGPAIEQEARKIIRTGNRDSILFQSLPGNDLQLLNAEQICVAADLGDELALQVIDKAPTYLGIALANLVNLFNPEAIILGGPIPRMCNSFVQTATKVMYQRAMSVLSSQTVIKTATFKEIGGALGTANFALDKHLSLANLQSKKSF